MSRSGRPTTCVCHDLRVLTDRLHYQGFRAIAYKNADRYERQPNRALPEQLGLLVRDPRGAAYLLQHHPVSSVDFTNPDAVAWSGQLWRRALDVLGFDGSMLDLGEIVPDDARYADGTTGVETRNRYLGLYARASFEPQAHQHVYDGTVLRTRFDEGALTLSVESAPLERSYDLRLPVPAIPARVSLDGSPVDGWDCRTGTLSLSVPAGSFTVRVEP